MRFYADDVGYHFEAPIPISNSADVGKAYEVISEYCVAEAIAETVVGIPPEEKDLMLRGAKRYSEGEDEDGNLAIRIVTECMGCDDLPETMIDDVYLGEFALSYADEYEKLIKNVNLNVHFGYNILDDIPDGDGKAFVENARGEFEKGESMTFAATVLSERGENIFVGEGCLYAFDGRAEASASFRVLPEFHRRGIGTKIFRGLLKIGKDIGLERIKCDIKTENKASLALMERFAAPIRADLVKKTYIIELDSI